jgi:hypothetical protein
VDPSHLGSTFGRSQSQHDEQLNYGSENDRSSETDPALGDRLRSLRALLLSLGGGQSCDRQFSHDHYYHHVARRDHDDDDNYDAALRQHHYYDDNYDDYDVARRDHDDDHHVARRDDHHNHHAALHHHSDPPHAAGPVLAREGQRRDLRSATLGRGRHVQSAPRAHRESHEDDDGMGCPSSAPAHSRRNGTL